VCAIVQHAKVQWKWQPDRQHPLKTVLDGAVRTKDVRNAVHTVPFVLDHFSKGLGLLDVSAKPKTHCSLLARRPLLYFDL
jgi:hypothetical protein